MALRQQEESINEETAAMARQSEELTQQLSVLRAEKIRLEEKQKELEQEWDAGRTRVTQAEDHLRMARQTLQEMRDARGKFEIEKARMIPTAPTCAKLVSPKSTPSRKT